MYEYLNYVDAVFMYEFKHKSIILILPYKLKCNKVQEVIPMSVCVLHMTLLLEAVVGN